MADHRRIYVLAAVVLLSCLLIVFSFTPLPDNSNEVSDGEKKFVSFQGTPQELAIYVLSGKEKGPTVLIVAGIHGDERGGYLTVERYRNIKVNRGTLILIPRLNTFAIAKGTRHGINGDMNRLFHLPDNTKATADSKVVNAIKSYIKKADYVLNLHQGSGFYYPRWISKKRNPLNWGQCNIIDAPTFDLPNGEKLELARFAGRVASLSNSKITNKQYYFHVNNTNTAAAHSRHKEQRRSLTYYALYKAHKMALAIEATKSCSLPQAVSFLTIAVNAVLGDVGIQAEGLPSTDLRPIGEELKSKGFAG